jgi:hypothetical protein
LNFRHNLRRLIYVVAGLLLFWALASAALTAILNAQLSALRPMFDVEGLTFGYGRATFNLFSGAAVNDFYCEDTLAPLWRIKRLSIGFDVSSILRGQIKVKNLVFGESRIDPARIFARADNLGRIAGRMNKNVGFFATTYFGCNRLNLGDGGAIAVKGYLSSLQGGLYVSKGELTLVSAAFLQKLDPAALDGPGGIADPFDYLLDVQVKDGAWEVQRLEINNAVIHCVGSGKIDGAGTEEATMDMTLNMPHVILDDMPVINSKDMQTRGLAEFTLHLSGLFSRPEVTAALKIDNAEQEIFGGLSVRKVNGSVIYEKNKVTSSKIDLFLNQLPFQVDFSVDTGSRPHILLNLSSVPQGKEPPDFVVHVDADWTEAHRLKGEASGSWRYVSKDLVHRTAFAVEGLEAGIDQDLFFSSDGVRISFDVTAELGGSVKDVFHRTFILEDISVVGKKQKEGFALEPLRAACYGGVLEGRLFVYSAPGTFGANAEGHVRGVDLQAFAEETPEETSLILGRLDGDLKFDTELKDMLKGQLFVTNGVIEQNSLMNAVADFLGVPSLKKIAFKDLSVFFNGGRGDYSSKVSLESDDVSALLEGHITTYDTMDGYLSVVISTRLLNESKQFKKILAYIKHDQPSVSFPFKISSYIDSPRILWLKNEFKEKLSNLLPERNKRYLQKQVSSMVEGIKVE